MDQRGGFVNANGVVVSGGDLSRVAGAIYGTDSNVVVNGTGYYLHSFECGCENHDVAASCVCLVQSWVNFSSIKN